MVSDHSCSTWPSLNNKQKEQIVLYVVVFRYSLSSFIGKIKKDSATRVYILSIIHNWSYSSGILKDFLENEIYI